MKQEKNDRLFNVGPTSDFNQNSYEDLAACRLKYLYGFELVVFFNQTN